MPLGRSLFAVTLASVAGLACQALAADMTLDTVAWKSAPTRAEVDAAYPKGALGSATVADVELRCRLNLDGSLTGCDVATESPQHKGFGAAAKTLADRFVAYVPHAVVAANSPADLYLQFVLRDPSQRQNPVELLEPEQLSRGGTEPDVPVFPAAAAKAGFQSGMGVVDCDGAGGGSLVNCTIAREAPAGFGFGDLAATTAQAMTLNLWQNGEPVEGGRFRLPIYIDAPDAASDPTLTRSAIFHVTKGWAGTAGPYFPDRALRMGVNGSALIECVVSADGSLNDCIPKSESAPDFGFADAALQMARKGAITAAPRIVDGHPLASEVIQVEVPFTA